MNEQQEFTTQVARPGERVTSKAKSSGAAQVDASLLPHSAGFGAEDLPLRPMHLHAARRKSHTDHGDGVRIGLNPPCHLR